MTKDELIVMQFQLETALEAVKLAKKQFSKSGDQSLVARCKIVVRKVCQDLLVRYL